MIRKPRWVSVVHAGAPANVARRTVVHINLVGDRVEIGVIDANVYGANCLTAQSGKTHRRIRNLPGKGTAQLAGFGERVRVVAGSFPRLNYSILRGTGGSDAINSFDHTSPY